MLEGSCRTRLEKDAKPINYPDYDGCCAVSASGCNWQWGESAAPEMVVVDDRLAANPINKRDPSGMLATVNEINGTFTVKPLDTKDLDPYEEEIDRDTFGYMQRAVGAGFEVNYTPDARHAKLGLTIHVGQVISLDKGDAQWDVGDWRDPFGKEYPHSFGLPSYAVNPLTHKSDRDHAVGVLGHAGIYSYLDAPGSTTPDATHTFDIELIAYTTCASKVPNIVNGTTLGFKTRVLGAAKFRFTSGDRLSNPKYDMPAPPWVFNGRIWSATAMEPTTFAAKVIENW